MYLWEFLIQVKSRSVHRKTPCASSNYNNFIQQKLKYNHVQLTTMCVKETMSQRCQSIIHVQSCSHITCLAWSCRLLKPATKTMIEQIIPHKSWIRSYHQPSTHRTAMCCNDDNPLTVMQYDHLSSLILRSHLYPCSPCFLECEITSDIAPLLQEADDANDSHLLPKKPLSLTINVRVSIWVASSSRRSMQQHLPQFVDTWPTVCNSQQEDDVFINFILQQ